MSPRSAVLVIGVLEALGACGRGGFDPLPVPIDASELVDPALLAWWPLGEQAGEVVVVDASGRGHDLRCGPVCPTSVDGHQGGRAAHFDGATQYLSVARDDELDLVAPYTIALWAKPERVPSFFEAFIARPVGSGEVNSYALNIVASGVAEFYTGDQEHLTGTSSMQLGAWTHIAATYAGTTKRLYVNGLFDQTQSSPASTYDASPLFIGADTAGGVVEGHFLGALEDVRIYDRVLSDAEITGLASR